MATEVATTRKSPPAIVSLLDQKQDEIQNALGASEVPSARFIRTAKNALMNNPTLMSCNANDVYREVMKAATDGLIVDNKLAALLIFKGKPQYVPMYQGLITLARRSGQLFGIHASLVYENELNPDPETGWPRFRMWTDDVGPHIVHNPIIRPADRGELVGAYSYARVRGPRDQVIPDICYMPIEEIEAIKARSPSKDRKTGKVVGPWKTDYTEMVKKTVFRRHAKTLPLDSDLSRAFSRVDELYGSDVDPDEEAQRGVGASRLNALADEDNVIEGEATEAAPEPDAPADEPDHETPDGDKGEEEPPPAEEPESDDYSGDDDII